MTMVKFCGIRTPADTAIVNRLRPEFIGMVFVPGRKRTIGIDTAVDINNNLDPDIIPVGVFSDPTMEDILRVTDTNAIRIVQLHGNESEEFIEEVGERTGLPVIKAFTVRTREDVEEACRTKADYVMFDSGAGTGRTFDWSVLEDSPRPFFLAGGLNPDNVYEAIIRLHPLAVDVSSGIETEDNKDEFKMQRFIESVYEADGSM
jgi:phosphoribosylanthranilate isomerase